MRLSGLRNAAMALLVVAVAAWGGWRLLNVYTVRTYQGFLAPTHEFLRAGLALDSAGLVRRGAEPAAVRWALAAGRRSADFLRALDRSLYVGHGLRNGDTTLVLFGTRSFGLCRGWPLSVAFAGTPPAARIRSVTDGCRELAAS